MIVNGWQLFYFRLFRAALDELEHTVADLARRDPAGYKSHPPTRLLASVYRVITELVPANPDHPDFRLGKTLGSEYANWRRVKKGMPDGVRIGDRPRFSHIAMPNLIKLRPLYSRTKCSGEG